jgi:hypothetical protein
MRTNKAISSRGGGGGGIISPNLIHMMMM